jgi:hypothetical protein
MNRRNFGVSVLIAAAFAACAKSPAAPGGAATVTTPALASPANGATIANLSQPVTLTITNALVTKAGSSVTYTFEVATDSGFTSKVATKDVAQGQGVTRVTLDTLTPGRDYFWHVRTTGGDTVGTFTDALKFTVGPAVVIQVPVPLSPASGSTTSLLRPTLIATNAVRSGPIGNLVYRFDISLNSTFSSILTSGTVSEGPSTTTFTPSSDLPENTTFFWRVQVADAANGITTAFTTAQQFGTVTTIDLLTTSINYQRFVNVSQWPITNKVTGVDQDGGTGGMCVFHEKSGIWPTADFFGDPEVQVEGNQWYFARINGQWYAGSGEWLRKGQTCKAGQYTEFIGPDGTWGGPMDNWAPKVGELVGYMITTPARDYPNFKTIDQRSAVVLVPWRDSRVK